MTLIDSAPPPTPWRPPGLIRWTLRRQWLGILAAWLLGSGAAVATAYSYFQPTYRAFSLIRVEPAVTDLINVRQAGDPLGPYLQTQLQLITSPNVLTAAATNPKVAVIERIAKAGDVVQELRKSISVSVVPNTYLIEVAMISPNAFEAATIVNAVVDAFMAASETSSASMTREEINNLEKYQVDLENQTDELERRWRGLASRGDVDVAANAGNPGVQPHRASTVIEEYRQAREQLHAVELELARAQAWLTTAQEEARKLASGEIPADERGRVDRQIERRLKLDPVVSKHAGDVQAAETKLEESKRVDRDSEDPAIQANRRKLDDLVRRYRESRDDKSQALRERIEPEGNAPTPEQEVQEANAAVKKLLAGRAGTMAKFDRLEVGRGRRDAVEIALIQDGRETFKSMLDTVTRRLEQLRHRAKGEIRIRPVHPNGASVPIRPLRDGRPLIFGLIPCLMLFGAVGLFVGVEAWSGPTTAKEKAEPIREV